MGNSVELNEGLLVDESGTKIGAAAIYDLATPTFESVSVITDFQAENATITGQLGVVGSITGDELFAGTNVDVGTSLSVGTFATVAGLLTLNGGLTINGLPTADPHASGQVWNSSGTLKISAG